MVTVNLQCNSLSQIYSSVFKPGVHWPKAAPGFLKLFSCGCWYVCLCVSTPRAIKNYSREMKSEQPIKQILLPFSFSV